MDVLLLKEQDLGSGPPRILCHEAANLGAKPAENNEILCGREHPGDSDPGLNKATTNSWASICASVYSPER